MISGQLEISLGQMKKIPSAGDSVAIWPSVPHTYHALENSEVLESFYPLREDILASI